MPRSQAIEVTTNARDVAEMFRTVFTSQVPFATALALTDLAFMGQRAAKAELAKDLTLRNRFSESGIQVERAEKNDWPEQEAAVGIEERRSYLVDHILGKRRKPQSSPFKAVPNEDVVKRGRTGKVLVGQRPRALLKKANAPRRGVQTERYVLSDEGDAEALFKFTTDSTEPVLVYWFAKSAWIRKRFDMVETVGREIAGQYPSALAKAYDRAIKVPK